MSEQANLHLEQENWRVFKVKVCNWFDETDEFTDYIKRGTTNLNSDCKIQSLKHMVSISAWVSWNDEIIRFYYYGDESFTNFGVIELHGKKFMNLCPEYYTEIKCAMNSLGIHHNDDPQVIYRFHVFLAELALFNNESEYPITEGDCYTFTHEFIPLTLIDN